MLLLSKVRDSVYFICLRGRIWEAVRGRVRPWGSHWLRDLPEPIRGARPLTASHGLSLLSCDLSEPIRGARPHTASHGLPNSASQTYKIHRISNAHGLTDLRVRSVRPIGLSCTPGDAMRLAVKSVRRPRGSDCIARCA